MGRLTRLSRGFAIFGILFLLATVALGEAPSPRFGAAPAHAQAATEVFQEGGQVIPSNDCTLLPAADRWKCKLLAGVPSHRTAAGEAATADADPTGGTVGYCVAITEEGHVAATGNNGFAATNATILSTQYFNNGSATTTDDVYCAVIQATPATTSARPPVDLSFTYTEGGSLVTIHIELTAITVRLVGTNGVVGGSAQVCTQGWDPTFLTGRTSNDPPQVPNPLDVVTVDDWRVLSPVTVAKVGVLRQPNTNEWCVTLTSPTPAADIDIAFDFWAVFNPQSASDDYLATVTGTDVVDIEAATAAELRHVIGAEDPDEAQLIPDQVAPTNVVGAPHTACVIPSVSDDRLNASQIEFVSNDGARGQVLAVFNDATAGAPDLAGVVDGTLCFTWTSSTPGSQGVTLQFNASSENPLPVTGTVSATWDTNGDGNPSGDEPMGPAGGLLFKRWATLDHTVITVGGDITENIVTNSTVSLPVNFNVADGSFLGSISLTEWVVGTRPAPAGQPAISEPVDGAVVTLAIEGACGYFETDPPSFTRTIVATSQNGRVQFTVGVDNDTDCIAGAAIRVSIVATYPAGVVAPPIAHETVDIIVQFTPNSTRAPIVRWVGQAATITYAFAGNCQGGVATFTVTGSQSGTFMPDTMPAEVGDSIARVAITADSGCLATIRYESEDQGEVDIVAQLDCSECDPPLDTGVFSKVVFPIYFLQFEDLSLTVAEELTVSERGDLDAEVRGWFLGANPSPREAERTEDGRRLPEGRWVLPDDWPLLKGPEGFRANWPGVADMPPAKVTFYLADEPVRNDFRTGAKSGSSGFLLPDGPGELDFNVDPVSGKPSVLGSLQKPRIMSEFTDLDGYTGIDVFGDLNLTFEECAVNIPTGNPYCEPGEVAGRASYYAIADYPELRGKHPPVTSNRASTRFTWQGYKRVTIEETEAPGVKYVVAHLRDRDGFCDALSYNNVLGIPVQFLIDAGDGIITEVQSPPVLVADGKRSATATTYDTQDDAGNPMNATLVKTVIEEDECQAWIKVSNSLQGEVNVLVHFPAQPVAVPGNLRITNLVCGAGGEVTVTNMGADPVSLAGFAIRSWNPSNIQNPEEHLGLAGLLAPGQSVTVQGDATPEDTAWLFADEFVFGNVGNDYARLIWNETSVSLRTCAGEQRDTPSPAQDADGEGAILLDLVVSFATEEEVQLSPGWNLVGGPGSETSFEQAFGADAAAVVAVYTWDAETGEWLRYLPNDDAPGDTLDAFEPGRVYWIEVNRRFTLSLRK